MIIEKRTQLLSDVLHLNYFSFLSVLWPTSQRKGSSQEAGTTDSPDLLQVSIFKQGGTERSRNEAAGAHTAGKADLAVVLVS